MPFMEPEISKFSMRYIPSSYMDRLAMQGFFHPRNLVVRRRVVVSEAMSLSVRPVISLYNAYNMR
jgi:hypothetical protein